MQDQVSRNSLTSEERMTIAQICNENILAGIKFVFLVNGGAVVALLTYMAQTDHHPYTSLVIFSLGALFASLCALLSALSWLWVFDHEGNTSDLGRRLSNGAVLAGMASWACSALGTIFVAVYFSSA